MSPFNRILCILAIDESPVNILFVNIVLILQNWCIVHNILLINSFGRIRQEYDDWLYVFSLIEVELINFPKQKLCLFANFVKNFLHLLALLYFYHIHYS